ncbi:hypothetical protein MPSEU_000143600 [Mayamaea pseudoterrestris]|nr:hypothetical protein MPSEU_000143600 [Mayamaea pseudoterrestris]
MSSRSVSVSMRHITWLSTTNADDASVETKSEKKLRRWAASGQRPRLGRSLSLSLARSSTVALEAPINIQRQDSMSSLKSDRLASDRFTRSRGIFNRAPTSKAIPTLQRQDSLHSVASEKPFRLGRTLSVARQRLMNVKAPNDIRRQGSATTAASEKSTKSRSKEFSRRGQRRGTASYPVLDQALSFASRMINGDDGSTSQGSTESESCEKKTRNIPKYKLAIERTPSFSTRRLKNMKMTSAYLGKEGTLLSRSRSSTPACRPSYSQSIAPKRSTSFDSVRKYSSNVQETRKGTPRSSTPSPRQGQTRVETSETAELEITHRTMESPRSTRPQTTSKVKQGIWLKAALQAIRAHQINGSKQARKETLTTVLSSPPEECEVNGRATTTLNSLIMTADHYVAEILPTNIGKVSRESRSDFFGGQVSKAPNTSTTVSDVKSEGEEHLTYIDDDDSVASMDLLCKWLACENVELTEAEVYAKKQRAIQNGKLLPDTVITSLSGNEYVMHPLTLPQAPAPPEPTRGRQRRRTSRL